MLWITILSFAAICLAKLPLPIASPVKDLVPRDGPGFHVNEFNATVADDCTGIIVATGTAGFVFIPADPGNCTDDGSQAGQVAGQFVTNQTATHGGIQGTDETSQPSQELNTTDNGVVEASVPAPSGFGIFTTTLSGLNITSADILAALNDTALCLTSLSGSATGDNFGAPPAPALSDLQSTIMNTQVTLLTCPLMAMNQTVQQPNNTQTQQQAQNTTNQSDNNTQNQQTDNNTPGDTGNGGGGDTSLGTNPLPAVLPAIPATSGSTVLTPAILAAAALSASVAAASFAGLPDNAGSSDDACSGSAPANPAFNQPQITAQVSTPFGFANESVPIANTTNLEFTSESLATAKTTSLVFAGEYGQNLDREVFAGLVNALYTNVTNGAKPSQGPIVVTNGSVVANFSVQNGFAAEADEAFPGVVALFQWFLCQGGSNDILGTVFHSGDYVKGQGIPAAKEILLATLYTYG